MVKYRETWSQVSLVTATPWTLMYVCSHHVHCVLTTGGHWSLAVCHKKAVEE